MHPPYWRNVPPATGTYEIDRQRHLQALQKHLPTEVEKMTWPLERLHHLRDERLRALVRVAKAYSPWYAKRLRSLDPDTLRAQDLERIPPMTKDDLMAHFDEIVTDHRLTLDLVNRHLAFVNQEGPAYLLDQYHVIVSSGTSQVRGVFVWDFEGWLQRKLVNYRHFAWLTRHVASKAGERVAYLIPGMPTYASRSSIETFRRNSRIFAIHTPIEELVDQLNAFQPTTLMSCGYHRLSLLAREQRAGSLHIVPQLLIMTGEVLSDQRRRALQEAFGIGVTDCYACSENGSMAWSYPGVSALHLIEDTVIYEPVDAHYQPVPIGTQAAKILTTNVINQVMPLIRYEINDKVTLLSMPNTEAWTGRQIAPIQGRYSEAFCYPDNVEVVPILLKNLLDQQIAIDTYQIQQTQRGVTIQMKLNPRYPIDLERVKLEMVQALSRHRVKDPEVTLVPVDHLDTLGPTGKSRSSIPLTRA